MTTISIDYTTRERIKSIGKKGETYDDIINKLIDDKNGDQEKTKPLKKL